MELRRYQDPRQFQSVAWPFLLRNEAANNIILGMVPQLTVASGALLCTFHADDRADAPVLAAAMMMRQRPLNITDGPDETVDLLVEALLEDPAAVTSMLGTPRAADRFAQLWTMRAGAPVTRTLGLAAHQLERVIPPRPAPGVMRCAEPSDMPLASQWVDAFATLIGEPTTESEGKARQAIESKRLFLWEVEGEPVSMAAWTRPMPNGVAIGLVYTPAEHRGRGYASNCVAALSQRMLDSGKRFVALYTDVANPTSNKIYQQIGYQKVCESKHVYFESGGTHASS